MASGSDQASSSLGEKDLGTLHSALYPARNSYKSLGLQLGVKIGEVESIESKYTDPGERLLGILRARMKKAEPLTWNDIDSALRLDCVDEGKTADDIRKKYRHLFSLDPTAVEKRKEKAEKETRKNDKGTVDDRSRDRGRKERQDEDWDRGRRDRDKDRDQERRERQDEDRDRGRRERQDEDWDRGRREGEDEDWDRRRSERQDEDWDRKRRERQDEDGDRRRRERQDEDWDRKRRERQDEDRDRGRRERQDDYRDRGRRERQDEDLDRGRRDRQDEDKDRGTRVRHEDRSRGRRERQDEDRDRGRRERQDEDWDRRRRDRQDEDWDRGRRERQDEDRDRGRRDRQDEDRRDKRWDQRRRERHNEDRESELESSEPEQPSMDVQRNGRKCAVDHGEKYEKSKQKVKKKAKRKAVRETSSSSETDNSSPECDGVRILSKSENKKLVSIFKCAYGKLCYAIKDPNEMAVQLQAKRMLSRSEMEDILKSPESQQVKAISLVRSLYRKIKSRPNKVFTVSEIFVKNKTLKELGREISFEIGKVCPDGETPVVGPSETPQDNSKEIPENIIHRPLPVASSDEHSGMLSSPKVSRPLKQSVPSLILTPQIPQLGLSPVLTQYKEYLKSRYTARALAPADKYLPTLSVPYINLAMVGREYYDPEQRDEFTRQTLHGGVDQILQSKTPINIADLLTPEEGGRPVRFILVEGPPGIGKSTFAWEVCRRWDEIESLRDYDTVVLLKSREKWVLNAASLSDIFRYPFQPEFSKNIAYELDRSNGLNLLLILDGFDEVSHSFHETSVIKSILCKELLPECTIILTTRPSAKHTLRSFCQPVVDKHVEIIGFAEEERVRYITEVFSKEPELQVNFLKYMFLVPHIKSMMYTPLNCAIIAQVYYESQSSRHLIIPKTRTQLYKALTHSLLVRHMKMKENDFECTSNLPEGLNKEDMNMFKTLAKFAFDTYHKVGESRKVTFFKEDIPEGLVHFGFMNESTEMYAGKGVERTFSFLHLSLQEYLAAWHLANSYSIEFQVAYHWLACNDPDESLLYKGENEEEKDLLLSLEEQNVSLVEPALFLAGITGWRAQSKDTKNLWEVYLSHDTADIEHGSSLCVLLRSLYEAQNPSLLPHYFSADSVEKFDDEFIEDGLPSPRRIPNISSNLTPYDCYALSYCLAHSSDTFAVEVSINKKEDTSLVEIFTKGLEDHRDTTSSKVSHLRLDTNTECLEGTLIWIMRNNFFSETEAVYLPLTIISCTFLKSLGKLQLLHIELDSPVSWESLTAINSLFSKLEVLRIWSYEQCNPPPTDLVWWPEDHKLSKLKLDIEFTPDKYDIICSPIDLFFKCVLKSVLRSNQITKMILSNISRGTMAGVRSILLHCPSLTTLELKRTRLGYDGILYICSALRTNTTLRHIMIHDVLPSPPSIITFSSIEMVPLPSKSTNTDFLLQINNILNENSTLEKIKIQSGLFLPLSVSAGGDGEYHQWTGLGPLLHFNVGAVASGVSPNLRRSFSLSDLTQPQTQLFKKYYERTSEPIQEIDFKRFFLLRKEEGKKLFSRRSFTAPDTQVLQSFSGLDPRLKECLERSHLNQNVETLKQTYWGMLNDVATFLD